MFTRDNAKSLMSKLDPGVHALCQQEVAHVTVTLLVAAAHYLLLVGTTASAASKTCFETKFLIFFYSERNKTCFETKVLIFVVLRELAGLLCQFIQIIIKVINLKK